MQNFIFADAPAFSGPHSEEILSQFQAVDFHHQCRRMRQESIVGDAAGRYAQHARVESKPLDEGMDMLVRPFNIDALAHKTKAMLN